MGAVWESGNRDSSVQTRDGALTLEMTSERCRSEKYELRTEVRWQQPGVNSTSLFTVNKESAGHDGRGLFLAFGFRCFVSWRTSTHAFLVVALRMTVACAVPPFECSN